MLRQYRQIPVYVHRIRVSRYASDQNIKGKSRPVYVRKTELIARECTRAATALREFRVDTRR